MSHISLRNSKIKQTLTDRYIRFVSCQLEYLKPANKYYLIFAFILLETLLNYILFQGAVTAATAFSVPGVILLVNGALLSENAEPPYIVQKLERRRIATSILHHKIPPNKEDNLTIYLPPIEWNDSIEFKTFRECITSTSEDWPPNIRVDHALEVCDFWLNKIFKLQTETRT